MLKRLAVLCALTGMAFGQTSVRYDSAVTTTATNVPINAQAAVLTVPNAIVTVCAYPPSGIPCTNTISIYQDQSLTTQLDNPLTADPKGRFGFWLPSGQYFYSVQNSKGQNVGGFPLSLLQGVSATIIDVSTFSGADICAKINSAALANPGSILDARRISGTQACATNPFAGVTGDIVLYLGEVYIQTTAPWVTNSQYGALIYGAGRGTLSTVNPHGTTIQAVSGFPATCDGLGAACPVVRLGDFSGGPNGAFGHRFENLTVDCNSIPGSIGFYSNDIQEQSGLNHFEVVNCPVYGVLMDGSFGSGKGAENYTIYDGEVYSLAASTTSTVQVKIIGSAASHAAMRLIENVTAISSLTVHAAAGFQFVSTYTGTAIGLNSEQNTTGYDIGPGGNFVDGLTLTSLTCGLNTMTCVWIHAGSQDINLFTVNNGSGNPTLVDDTAIPAGNSISDSFLSYMTADSGGIRWNSSHFTANSGNGMAATSLHLTSTTGETAPASFRQATDHPLTITLDSGLTTAQGQAIAFLDRGTGKWVLQEGGSSGINTDAFQLFDQTSNIPRIFFSNTTFNTGYTSIQSAGTAAVVVNGGTNSGTGGLQVCAGGSGTPACNFGVNAAGVASSAGQVGVTATIPVSGTCSLVVTGGIVTGHSGSGCP